MSAIALGIVAALAASVLFAGGLAMQAVEARTTGVEHALRLSLIRRLIHRPRWLIGTGLVALGWPLHAAALLWAPVTVVQPVLAFGLVILFGIGARILDEHVTRRQLLGTVAIVGGVAGLAAAAPARSGTHAASGPLAAAMVGVAAVAVAPYLFGPRLRAHGVALSASAGVAFAFSALATKLVADQLSGTTKVLAVAWLACACAGAAIGTLSEMTAFQTRPATRVAPIVFVLDTVLPVVIAPWLFREHWGADDEIVAALAVSLALVALGVAIVAGSPEVGTLVASAEGSGSGDWAGGS
jgi:drug/metabolite transporter (DMT)-like permease